MEDEIRVLFDNMRLLGVDLVAIQKTTRVQVNSQMFQKANHKGMALLVHTLLCLFDEKIAKSFSQCWFPYSMVEMREFKVVAGKVCDELVKKQKLQPTDLTKGVMETAAGIRMWQSLRTVSDAALFDRLKQYPSIVGQGIPVYRLTSQDVGLSLALPSKQNIDAKALDRAIRALQSQIVQQENQFTANAQEVSQFQQQWKSVANELNTKYHSEKQKQSQLQAEARKAGILDSQGKYVESQLTHDLREEGIQIIEQLPQIERARQAAKYITGIPEMLSRDSLIENLQTLFSGNLDDPQEVLSQDAILDKCNAKSQVREKVTQDGVFVVDNLVKEASQKYLKTLESFREDRITDETLRELDQMAEAHKRTIDELRFINKKLS